MTTIFKFRSPTAKIRSQFIESLAQDIRIAGHRFEISETDDYIEFTFEKRDFSDAPKEEVRQIYQTLRRRKLAAKAEMIERLEQNGILAEVSAGHEIDIHCIHPEIRFCSPQYPAFKYFSLFQSVTSEPRGRRICALVYDVGQATPTLMGIFALGSAMYSIKARDSFLDWDTVDSRSRAKAVRDSGLKRMLQLSICMALEPYSFLHAGKLMAMLALSSPVQEAYQRIYGNPLLAVVTTAAYGPHAAIFNRLQRNKFVPTDKFIGDARARFPHEFYQRLGFTSDTAYFILSERTRTLAHQLAASTTRAGKKAVYQALRMCGISPQILSLNRKGIYIGYLHRDNIELLRNPDAGVNPVLELDPSEVIEYWKQHWLERAKSRTDKMHEFQAFNPSPLSAVLN